ncbi:hypothetical protein COCMIDRAFT_90872 [Bipolaris oryzae ATCC 44560]|uniref:Uncharacterized protein n=3 Tax=Bipolaris TaxID=33194 RepID=W6YC07_COCC2|nr:uncharacterized protein COCMIDRAFT_90872 [Bipolaris oryzae ATCC 44560]XP_007708509.1 uncharacterized protein COCCADRAFT_1881 [Bipolaris zeicola 26-R-13]XP_014556136.1 hypothetical protein COCVIDRAFT_100508 [Bipolaris victoriae FI3]EUC37102.1 hypothetical protein COCCADRAFT_1881 [Bipolaris zeicola 26-R-13]EUC47185.1 hypothetical protein COCMIDRAFT_90872 [Bipolaris oryzae ATCC 44560]
MCVAELCVTVLPCKHRWYHLVRPCTPSSNLSTCGKKLGISGWEVKCNHCPYCHGHVSEFEYKLIGDGPAPPVGSLSGLARAHSTSLNAARRDIRLDNITRTDSATSVGSKSSLVTAASEKNRAMNSRLDAYFFPSPDSPYPAVREDDNESNPGGSPSDTSVSDYSSVRHASISMPAGAETHKANMLSRVRQRTKRISGIFR